LSILALAAILLAAYSLLLHWTGLRAELAESNLQANLIRVSNYLYEKPTSIALVGSSVAGRLLPKYFQESELEVQNLGLDGSCPLFAFEIIRQRSALPRYILVDTYSLFQPLSTNDETLREAVDSPSFFASKRLVAMRSSSRPSSILYSRLKQLKDNAGRGTIKSPESTLHQSTTQRTVFWNPRDQYPYVRSAIQDLQRNGVHVSLLVIPSGEGWGIPARGPERALADELKVLLIQPGPVLATANKTMSFSDAIHLDSPSAKRVAEKICEIMQDSRSD